MANRSHPITGVPVDLKTVAGLALVEGTSYIVQNRGVSPIFWAEAVVAPDPATEEVSFSIDPKAFATMPVKSDPIWCWVLSNFSASFRVNEAS